ncbi:DEAD/DEAH box helicase [Paenibacillus brevis]|uniref:DEAD/DEAH box helicase family protein n=1 Tax=Paenibacillus brevis TaxID=2841508 RepID=A0ABS6FL86_9BACL|nr:helicase-related protein [Paenibacillus brevis]MBU5670943.1 DEAD/DEAH box helicase family protein [Paenibacillus brevis]
MRVSLYAVKVKTGWKMEFSLDLEVDIWWWMEKKHKLEYEPVNKRKVSGNSQRRREVLTERIILLSESIPLGWAVLLRNHFKESAMCDKWTNKQWREYIVNELQVELTLERNSGHHQASSVLLEPMIHIREVDAREIRDREYEKGKENELNSDRWSVLEEQASRLADALAGRSLLEGELQQLLAERMPDLVPAWRSALQHAHLQGRVLFGPGVAQADAHGRPRRLFRRGKGLRCRRCGSGVNRRTPCGSCGLSGCAYCEACLALGRSRSCALLLRGSSAWLPRAGEGPAAAGSPTKESMLDRWGLSPSQRDAASAALQFLAQQNQRRFLLWAVTGAGKTEMIFPLLQFTLDRGGKALVATPRRDVVLELAPRMAKAFPETQPVVLYGGSSQRWEEGALYLATTHQLMRFHQAFDLVVIDELDAFPYHNDPMLAYAAEASCKPEGSFIYLSATPPARLQREARSGQLPYARVPVRYHRHPLPVPGRISMRPVSQCLSKEMLPSALLASLRCSLERGAQVFCFVSRIRHIAPVVMLLQSHFPSYVIGGTSSQDAERGNKVEDFRASRIRLLVTTTILERGVTIPKSDVYILDAHSDLFDEASLVQMAGRAGRSLQDPEGRVLFASPEWTKSQRGAIRQIRTMNKIASDNGYLVEKGA